jgi:hypothetical protein
MKIKLCNNIVRYIYMHYVRIYKAKCVLKSKEMKSKE